MKNEVLFIMQSKRKLNLSEESLYYCMQCVEQSTENIMGYDIDFDFRTALPIDVNFLEKAQKVCMVCEHFQIINPGLFDHLQEKLKMPLQTKRSVCHALSCLKTGLFRDGITWAKVIAFYAFIGALVVECITKGNCQYIVNIIYAVKQFIDGELVPWIKENEGWVSYSLYYLATQAQYQRNRLHIMIKQRDGKVSINAKYFEFTFRLSTPLTRLHLQPFNIIIISRKTIQVSRNE